MEILARWFHERLADAIAAAGGEALAVRVWESPTAFGGYRAGVPTSSDVGAIDPDTEAAGVLQPPAAPAERDELAIEVARKSTSALERIALPAPKCQPGRRA